MLSVGAGRRVDSLLLRRSPAGSSEIDHLRPRCSSTPGKPASFRHSASNVVSSIFCLTTSILRGLELDLNDLVLVGLALVMVLEAMPLQRGCEAAKTTQVNDQ